jgi:steroid 5-alpha reductase family enzyme
VTLVRAALIGLATIVGVLTLVWLASIRRRDVSIVDIWWGPGFSLLAWLYCALLGAFQPRPVLLAVLLTIWGVRLGLHLATRPGKEGEDRRYAAMRVRYGTAFTWQSLFIVFWLQAGLLWFIALPVLAAAGSSTAGAFGLADVGGIVLFGAGFAFEAIGDAQLRRFKASRTSRGGFSIRGCGAIRGTRIILAMRCCGGACT